MWLFSINQHALHTELPLLDKLGMTSFLSDTCRYTPVCSHRALGHWGLGTLDTLGTGDWGVFTQLV